MVVIFEIGGQARLVRFARPVSPWGVLREMGRMNARPSDDREAAEALPILDWEPLDYQPKWARRGA